MDQTTVGLTKNGREARRHVLQLRMAGSPATTWGIQKNITDKTFEEAAKASKQFPKEAKSKTLELLKILLKKE